MSILKVAHYYQIKLAMAGREAYKQILALQAEINKIPQKKLITNNLNDEQIAQQTEIVQKINESIFMLKNQINNLSNQIYRKQYLSSKDLQWQMGKIKDILLRLSILGYAKEAAPSLSLANKIQIIEIEFIPEQETHTPPGLKITPSKVTNLEYGAGGLPGPPDIPEPDFPIGPPTDEETLILEDGSMIRASREYLNKAVDPSRTPKSVVVDRVGTSTVTPMKWNPKFKK